MSLAEQLYRRLEVRPSPIHGLGLFASESLSAGQRLLAIDDSRLVDASNPLRPELGEHDYHCDYLARGRVVLMAVPERHINHCCRPNVYVRTIDSVRHVIALENVAKGQEICFDYCINSGGDTLWQCNCGHASCRQEIHSDYFHLPLRLQLAYLPLLDEWFIGENRSALDRLRALAAKGGRRE